ncbi:PREDICTED: uncharacterized protein LOC106815016 [Priapulus caudatus]|uniref:Uncharacterized protein LOC106815016 n=1 Tax=Priapulus caudatus TaxID=37621 RepID=A0ABM1ERU2_PRICU|nr:PREDICTED: uncharacterized protein LOC106815016 [Priapulus caudatus]
MSILRKIFSKRTEDITFTAYIAFATGFQSKVLLRLQNIEEAQAQIFQMLRSLTSASKAAEEEDLEEILSGPADTVEELEQLCNRLTDHSFKKQMTCYLTSLGGRNIGDTITRMLRTVGTNALWSNYSMKGKKGKGCFIELSVAILITRACMKKHAKAKASEIQEEIGDCLKYGPKHKAGAKYKLEDIKEKVIPQKSDIAETEQQIGYVL